MYSILFTIIQPNWGIECTRMFVVVAAVYVKNPVLQFLIFEICHYDKLFLTAFVHFSFFFNKVCLVWCSFMKGTTAVCFEIEIWRSNYFYSGGRIWHSNGV